MKTKWVSLAMPVFVVLIVIIMLSSAGSAIYATPSGTQAVQSHSALGDVKEFRSHHNAEGTNVIFVNNSGSNAQGTGSQNNPYRTINYAVNIAKGFSGRVIIYVEPGVYQEQINVSNVIKPESLSIIGVNGRTSIEPSTLYYNVYEQHTSYLFDDLSGHLSAIVSVQNNTASISIMGLNVNGNNFQSSYPPGQSGEWAGIAFINTGGSIAFNKINNITTAKGEMQASVHGIEIKDMSGNAKVAVYRNTLGKNSGHIFINMISNGHLRAVVEHNVIVGNYSTNHSVVPASGQFGISSGGLAGLVIKHNRISDFSDAYGVAAIYLNPEAHGAHVVIEKNIITKSDMGIWLSSVTGVTISHNFISAGVAGIWVTRAYGLFGTMSGGPSSLVNITHNRIVGTDTVLTPDLIVAMPVDGILISDGHNNVITNNIISNWYNGIYLGEDSIFFNNTTSWGSAGIPTGLSGSTTSHNAIEHNIFISDKNAVVTGSV